MLKDAGIGCLKIEGRARRDYYVATATKIYRKALDNDTISHKELDDLKLAFNREYIPAYSYSLAVKNNFCRSIGIQFLCLVKGIR